MHPVKLIHSPKGVVPWMLLIVFWLGDIIGKRVQKFVLQK
jgi:hypothetical protein